MRSDGNGGRVGLCKRNEKGHRETDVTSGFNVSSKSGDTFRGSNNVSCCSRCMRRRGCEQQFSPAQIENGLVCGAGSDGPIVKRTSLLNYTHQMGQEISLHGVLIVGKVALQVKKNVGRKSESRIFGDVFAKNQKRSYGNMEATIRFST
jgi:hypothetical protein